jgi:hypothetical protein
MQTLQAQSTQWTLRFLNYFVINKFVGWFEHCRSSAGASFIYNTPVVKTTGFENHETCEAG